ncbi:MAG TPA: ABC transporter permease [Mycobacteriales bacterium]|jgi:peptide/nickel transport system permease protein|nr:ABC transporter permease [Mycobacteriales bacterium]
MTVDIARRLGFLVLTLAIASVVIFLVCAWLPGDAATTLLGTQATPAAVHQLRHQFGTDRPLVSQYGSWIGGLFRGDFGTSAVTKLQVWPQIQSRLAVTGCLVLVGMLFALIVAVPVGVFSAVRHRRVSGLVVSGLSQLGLAIPAFWAGILLSFFFAVKLHVLPPGGYVSFRQDQWEWFRHLILPGISLALVQGAVLGRYVRAAVLDVMREDYIRTARAGGATFSRALWRHGLRNASIPVVTVLGLQLATLLVGAIVIESVFTMPGLGLMLLQAVGNRDLVLVEGTVMILVGAVLILNFLVDLLYLALDPRLRSSR